MDVATLLQGYRDAVTVRRIYGDLEAGDRPRSTRAVRLPDWARARLPPVDLETHWTERDSQLFALLATVVVAVAPMRFRVRPMRLVDEGDEVLRPQSGRVRSPMS